MPLTTMPRSSFASRFACSDDRDEPLGDDRHAGLDLVVGHLVEPPHDAQHPVGDVGLAHGDERAQREALADAARRGDAQSRDAAVLDLPHRVARTTRSTPRANRARRARRAAPRAVGDRVDLDLLGARARVVGGFVDIARGRARGRCGRARRAPSPRPSPAMRGSRRRSALRFGATAGRTFSRIAIRCWLIGAAGPWSVGLGLAQRVDRALELLGERRRVEIAQHRARSRCRCGARARALPARSTKKPSGERGTASSCELAAPRAKLRARPVELGRRQVAGVELVDQQHEQVFLLDRPLRRVAARRSPSATATRSTPSSVARR